MFSLADTTKMEGNDFIIFKHGCGNDSSYLGPNEIEFSVETKARFAKPCDNYTFYHVELEYVGDQSYTFKYEQSDTEDETDEHPENNQTNPIIFKMRNATLLEWGLTDNGKEEIWFDKAPEVTLKSDRNKKGSMMRSVLYQYLSFLIFLI